MVGRPCRATLLASIDGPVAALPGASDDTVLTLLLVDAVRTLVAGNRAAFLTAWEASPPVSLSSLARLVAIHSPDPLTGCLVDVMLAGQGAVGADPLEEPALSHLHDAVAKGDRFAAPRIMQSLYGLSA
ncbi:hypothetical protein BH10PSE13_BH10PSE13_04870 [soil metagenome]